MLVFLFVLCLPAYWFFLSRIQCAKQPSEIGSTAAQENGLASHHPVAGTPARTSQTKASFQSVSKAKSGPVSGPSAENYGQPPEPEQDAAVKEVYKLLADAIRSDFPEIDLADSELMDLSRSVLDIRNAIADLHGLERSAKNSAYRRQLEDQRDKALWDFEQITGMSFTEFMLRAPADGGIDNDDSEGDDEIVLEPIDGS